MTLGLIRSSFNKRFRTVALPPDLDAITCIDHRNEVDPTLVDLDDGAVDAIWQDVQRLYRTGMYPLLSICLRREGKLLLNRSIGYQRGDASSADAVIANLDTPICLFSASKAISAMLVHLLAEQGKIHLLDPISYYIPAFAARGKAHITIYQLLTHRAGVPGLGDDVDPALLFDREAALQRIYEAKPIDHLGRTAAYHAITGGFIIDELIRVTTGLTAQQYLNRYIRKPMGMRYFRYGLTARDAANVAEHRSTGLPPGRIIGAALKRTLGIDVEEAIALSNGEAFRNTILPSANLYCTAEEAGRFFQMMLDYGHYRDKQIMQPLTVHRAIQESGKAEMDASLGIPMRYSPGFMLGGNPAGIYGRRSHYAYGHLGLSNVFCWADPERDISVAILNTGKPVIGPHLAALPNLLYSIPKHCPPRRNMDLDAAAFLGSRVLK